jgi:glutamate-1-semialdehyde aminotransferase/predicted aldo/keto reductase-like oxidoreductase
MEYRRLGRTGLKVSAVGFGTCQLRLVPRQQAIDTLLKGFDLGVNIVHTAPDYGTAEEIVGEALARTSAKVIVASQGYDVPGNSDGPVSHFERLFESTCKHVGTDRLDLYGIACIDDRECHRENVWGRQGMVEFLLKMKDSGRLGGIYCTTHGSPEYVQRLVTGGIFDAVMFAYNVLGYHLLSYPPPPDRDAESLTRNRQEIFPLCRQHDVGVMIMKPLAGGLLTPSKAFPPRHDACSTLGGTTAHDILRAILVHPEVTCVVPGTASVEEAEQNAASGHAPMPLDHAMQARLTASVSEISRTVCSRCGACDTLCSQHLPLSSIFWAGLFHLHPSGVLEQPDNIEYFRQHPSLASVCATCPDVTCVCPAGIDIPVSLITMHSRMVSLMHDGVIPAPASLAGTICGDAGFGARVVSMDVPKTMAPGRTCMCRLHVENAGERGWLPHHPEHQARVMLGVFVNGRRTQTLEVTQDVHRGGRWQFLFEITAPTATRRFGLRLQLLGEHLGFSEGLGPILLSEEIAVTSGDTSAATEPSLASKAVVMERTATTYGRVSELRSALRRLASWALRRASAPMANVGADDAASGATPAPRPEELRPYAVAWLDHNVPPSFRKGETLQVYLRVGNEGTRHWHAHHPEGRWVELLVYLGTTLQRSTRLPRDVPPGAEVLLTIPLAFPRESDESTWTVTLSFVEQQVAWFHEHGMAPLVVEVRAEEPAQGALADANAVARQSNGGMWLPSAGITRSRNGRPYPTFIEHAQGCRIRDPDGNEWIDYVMAGGAAVLGYAHPEVQEAIARQLASSAVVSLPHTLEVTATRLLCDMIPCAEMVLFGKHGSDSCTAAVRTARLHTGRRKVVYSGYHGWHDWFVGTLQPMLADPSQAAELFRFDLNDMASFDAVVAAHRGEIAAVIVEPAAQAATLDAPTAAADPVFLQHVADVCREQGAVLIFDEIVTGFRHPGGSVQQATGVIPDLACLGKALSGGMPLSALVGRRDVMQSSLVAAYMPTFRGEVYSLAAAVAALEIHRREDVPAQIDAIGRALQDAINSVSRELGVGGELIGVPFRMIYRFAEPDAQRRGLMRTLLQQELLQSGILTYKGFMLPSLAHGESEIAQTARAFRGALLKVMEVAAANAFVRHLEIPQF